MRRGEIWTVVGGKDHAGKPRPVVIVQDDGFDATNSITICAFTTDETEAPLFCLPVEPNERNGLRVACRLMVDKISTVQKAKIGARVGRLDHADIVRLNQAVLVFLGLAVSPRRAARGKPECGWATIRQPVRPEVVTHLLGTLCYLCVWLGQGDLAEGAGFEPAIRFPAYTLSRRAPSAARPPLRDRAPDRRKTRASRIARRAVRRKRSATGRPWTGSPALR